MLLSLLFEIVFNKTEVFNPIYLLKNFRIKKH